MDSSRFLLAFFLLPLLLRFPGGASDMEADKAALLAFSAAVGRALPWNKSEMPCSWEGLTCEHGRVTKLRIPACSLIGKIPAGTLGNLTALQSLSLRFNALSGPLPPDLAGCKELRRIYLENNHLSGEIPDGLFSLVNLVRLNLANNSFSGGISPGFNKLTHLAMLYLESNQLSGEIPDLTLPNIVMFNVSFNPLNGSIPKRLRGMPPDAFLGTSLCGGPLATCPGNTVPAGTRDKSNGSELSGWAITAIVIGVIVGFLIVVVVVLFIVCRSCLGCARRSAEPRRRPPAESELLSSGSGGLGVENGNGSCPVAAKEGNGRYHGLEFVSRVSKRYDLEDMLTASAEVLGKGEMGSTYTAMLEMGTIVVVKRLKDVKLPEKEFRDKIRAIGAMNHQNLVPLQAYFYSNDEKLLVYDYMPMGSLSSLLHWNRGSGGGPADWETRSRIALGAARGIEYIHSKGPGVLHGNIKSSNVLFGPSQETRVSEQGIANLMASTTPIDAAGYRAPEVTDSRKVSQQADVYSFGVLLLELLTGKAPTEPFLHERGIDLPTWVQSVVREEWTSEVFDVELLRYQSVEEEMVQLLQLAVECAARRPEKRPPMIEVVARIEEIRRSSLASPARSQQQDHRAFDDARDQSIIQAHLFH